MKYYINIPIYIIIFSLIFISFSISSQNQSFLKINKLSSYSEIILTINGGNSQKILNDQTV